MMGATARMWSDLNGSLVSTGSSNTFALNINNTPTELTATGALIWRANHRQSGSASLNVESLGARDIKRNHDVSLAPGDIESGMLCMTVYNRYHNYHELLNPAATAFTEAIDTNGNAINESEGTAVSAEATTNIWSTTGNTVHVISGGTAVITSLSTAPRVGAWRNVIFDAVFTLTHGANLNLPGGVNYTTVAGDMARAYADTTTQIDVQLYPMSIRGGDTIVYANGTVSSGTLTPDPAFGPMQSYTNGGAHTLAPPAASGMMMITITNNASAGAITTSGFGDVFGDAFTTTNGHVFMCGIFYDGTNSVLRVKALQ